MSKKRVYAAIEIADQEIRLIVLEIFEARPLHKGVFSFYISLIYTFFEFYYFLPCFYFNQKKSTS